MNAPSRRHFLRATAGSLAATVLGGAALAQPPKRPNVLLLTADDMNWNAPGCFGGTAPAITPNIDKLASQGVRFTHAHVTIAVCQPSRQTLMTGRYPHRFGALGFEPIDPKITTLQEQFHEAGYLNGILGKVAHLAPRRKFPWDMAVDFKDLVAGRDPGKYYRHAKEFLATAAKENKPFFLMANSHDPHRPFHAAAQERRLRNRFKNIPKPSRVYSPGEIRVPGFLPDIPDVRKEVAQYYASVRRCDDTVGAVLRALHESGLEDHTLVMFLSDNGMAFPFAKTNCYLHSTRTPWIVRWPGKVEPKTVDGRHFISGIDFMPTILELAGLPQVAGMDGASFLPALLGKGQPARDHVFTVFYKTAGRKLYPMRCLQTKRFGYIYNAWADGTTVFRNESQSGLTMKAMRAAAEGNPTIAARVKLFLHRVPEELYDFQADPDARHNLLDEPAHREQLDRMRQQMAAWMEKVQDPLLPTFRRRVAKRNA